jgi:hypothetical protein
LNLVTIDQIADDELDGLIERGDEEEERGGAYRQSPWWYQKDEGSISVLRFLEESPDWRKVPTHRFFPTKPEPDKHEGKWPEMMGATCRGAGLAKRFPNGCPICTSGYEGKFGKGSKAEDVRYTIAVEREQYEDENGRKKYRDKEIPAPMYDEAGEVIEGETITLPSIVLIGETMFKMMSAVKATGEALGTLRGRDIRLKLIKNPNGKNGLIFQPISLDSEPSIQPGTKHWEMYLETMKMWKPGGLVLNREILYRANAEYWDKFFLMDDGRTHAEHMIKRGAPADNPVSSSASEQADKPDPARLAAMRARISGN